MMFAARISVGDPSKSRLWVSALYCSWAIWAFLFWHGTSLRKEATPDAVLRFR